MPTIFKINSSPLQKTKVLIAPLDWGLGHATRCISIINELLAADFEVIIAAEGIQKKLLAAEFPALRIVELKGYRVKYALKRWLLPIKILMQLPKILIQINNENKWLKQFSEAENINVVISDNRFGMHSSNTFSVFITHQLAIQTPPGNALNWLLQKINYHFINQFDVCWVPDFEKENMLAGKLAHPKKLPAIPVHYIGLLARFEKMEGVKISNDVLILLSGPEPQRTIFEKIILEGLKNYTGNAILIRGLPGSEEIISAAANVQVYNHVSSHALNKMICASEFVISRSGYTTVMEMMKLEKKTIMVPTPGQTEQEYLGDYLFQNKRAFTVDQKFFSVQQALSVAKNFSYTITEMKNDDLLKKTITSLKDQTSLG